MTSVLYSSDTDVLFHGAVVTRQQHGPLHSESTCMCFNLFKKGVNFTGDLAPFCQAEFASTDISSATANTTTAALISAFGQEQVSALKSESACRRFPGVVG